MKLRLRSSEIPDHLKKFFRPAAPGLKPKDLCGIPWRLVFALQADGWWLRAEIIWAKPNPMPESVTDRPTKAHEQVFLLSKSPTYFWDAEAIKEKATCAGANPIRKTAGMMEQESDPARFRTRPAGKTCGCPESRNARSVWTIAPKPYAGAHFAVMPSELARRCIVAGTSAKGRCPHCGMCWEREVEREPMVLARSGRGEAMGEFGRTCTSGTMVRPPTSKTIGWAPTCTCPPHDPVPCVVLDPFGGAGTVPLVAEGLGRIGIGLDLSPEYCQMALRRIRRPHARVTRDRETPMPLFAGLNDREED